MDKRKEDSAATKMDAYTVEELQAICTAEFDKVFDKTVVDELADIAVDDTGKHALEASRSGGAAAYQVGHLLEKSTNPEGSRELKNSQAFSTIPKLENEIERETFFDLTSSPAFDVLEKPHAKWYRRSAYLGCSPGMLAVFYEFWQVGQHRQALDWLHECTRHGLTKNAQVSYNDSPCLLSFEVSKIEAMISTHFGKEQNEKDAAQGSAPSLGLHVPNLAGLMLAAGWKELLSSKECPAWYTQRDFQKLAKAHAQYPNKSFSYIYGRRGAFSAQDEKGSLRKIKNTLFKVGGESEREFTEADPRIPVCSTWAGQEGFDADYGMLLVKGVRIQCQHVKGDHLEVCAQCIAEGKRRLWAASQGLYACSVQEAGPGQGRYVMYICPGENVKDDKAFESGKDLEVRTEHFNNYSKVDISDALKTLVVASSFESGLELLTHPLFLAMDPNLFWPIVTSYRTVSEALIKHGHDSCFGIKGTEDSNLDTPEDSDLDTPAMRQIVYEPLNGDVILAARDSESRRMFAKCGLESCNALFWMGRDSNGKDRSGKVCSRCKIRRYCGRECQEKDYKLHRMECLACVQARG